MNSLDEFKLIERLIPMLHGNSRVVAGAGDDCAVLDLGLTEDWLLFKTDAVVEGIHFTPETPAAAVGHKALARALSDVAAMAGTPVAALVTLALPPGFDPERVIGIYSGLNALAARYDVAVAGGETTTNPDRLLLSISVLGKAPKKSCVLRRGAQAGDALFVTGELGGSLAGKHLDFEPRLKEAAWLAEHFKPTAMMDLSDGLAGDLRHMLAANGLGAEILKTAVPVSKAAREGARERARNGAGNKTALDAALSDGEDFELLFTMAPGRTVALMDAWKMKFPGLKLSCIGRMRRGEGIVLRDKSGFHTLKSKGYEHFKQPG